MKVVADREECIGSGSCTAAAPDVFDLGEGGVVVVLVEEVSGSRLKAVQDAVDLCPVEALSLEEAAGT